MNRTLRRPMFRTGGSAEGITSGLAPRQGYQDPPGKVEQNDLSKIDLRNMNMQQLKDLASRVSYKPRGTNFNDFLINMGLDLVSRPKSGNIYSNKLQHQQQDLIKDLLKENQQQERIKINYHKL